MEETIANKDTLIVIKELINMEKDKQLKLKDTLIEIRDRQIETIAKTIIQLQKENSHLRNYKWAFWGVMVAIGVKIITVIVK